MVTKYNDQPKNLNSTYFLPYCTGLRSSNITHNLTLQEMLYCIPSDQYTANLSSESRNRWRDWRLRLKSSMDFDFCFIMIINYFCFHTLLMFSQSYIFLYSFSLLVSFLFFPLVCILHVVVVVFFPTYFFFYRLAIYRRQGRALVPFCPS